ncbi:MAG TPA: hypothetical protein VFM30_11110 [Steroidobacteraceae bacterium]|nr:hypothetical protein [Steroidobacteraceae bacterium]
MKPQKRTSKTIRGFAATRDPRGVTKQAKKDLDRGLQDTDCRGVDKSADCPPTRRKRR